MNTQQVINAIKDNKLVLQSFSDQSSINSWLHCNLPNSLLGERPALDIIRELAQIEIYYLTLPYNNHHDEIAYEDGSVN